MLGDRIAKDAQMTHYYIKEILLADKFDRYSLKGQKLEGVKALTNLSKINIFVGENNSGKSMFLRTIAATEKLKFAPALPAGSSWDAIKRIHTNFIENCKGAFEQQGIKDNSVFPRLNSLPAVEFLQEQGTLLEQILKLAQTIAGMERFGAVTHQGHGFGDQSAVVRQLKQFAQTWFQNMRDVEAIPHEILPFEKIYVPTLRGLRNLTAEKDEKGFFRDLYREKTCNDFFPKPSCPNIFTGQSLYDEVMRLLLGTPQNRKDVHDFEDFLSQSFFDDKPVTLIPRLDPAVLHIKIGDEAERPVHHLGDGIQSVIILTFRLFANSGIPVLLYCEEPELYMHPGLQRIMVRAFHDRFPGHQIFLTTHSNHLLDLTFDFPNVAVFAFRKVFDDAQADEKDARFEIEEITSEDRRPLELLGVRNSSVFLSNCTIWVEGITDRRYFKTYLRLYQDSLPPERRRFREDWHYSFVEYGGACITHWSFLDDGSDAIDVERLCGKLFLIADGDTSTKWKGRRHEKLTTTLKERYCVLQCKEVENLLTPGVLKEVLKGYGEDAFQEFAQADYETAGLGEFVESKVIQGARKRRGSYADNETISDKVSFCAKAVEAMKSFDDLSAEGKEIAKRLYDFIAENNK